MCVSDVDLPRGREGKDWSVVFGERVISSNSNWSTGELDGCQ